MKMIALNKIFEVTYGNKLDLNKMTRIYLGDGGVNFVGRSSQNHGVSAVVAPIPDTKPYEAGLITVALGGSKLLSSFVQRAPFYTAQNVAVLRPRIRMTFRQKMYICLCIRHNRFRYSAFGREANRTLRTLLIPAPADFPAWLETNADDDIEAMRTPLAPYPIPSLDTGKWAYFKLGDLFAIKKGKRLTKSNMVPGDTPFVGASDSLNGVTSHVGQRPNHRANTISVSYNGSVAEAFYQPVPFWASDDVNVLYPKFDLTPEIGIFISTLIRLEKYRFSYGRKWHLERMNESAIRLPATESGAPDWEAMKRYIQSLSYSSQLAKQVSLLTIVPGSLAEDEIDAIT